jgi:hypothetical protein
VMFKKTCLWSCQYREKEVRRAKLVFWRNVKVATPTTSAVAIIAFVSISSSDLFLFSFVLRFTCSSVS